MKYSQGEQRLHSSCSPLQAPGVLMSFQTSKTAIASATGGAGVGAGEAAHCTEPPCGYIGLWQLNGQVGHLSLLIPCLLFQQLSKVLSKPLLVILHRPCLSLGFSLAMLLILLKET